MRPLVVVRGSERAFTTACSGFEHLVPEWCSEPGVVCAGVVADAADAAAALLAAVWGAGLVVHATAPAEVIERFIEDLHRLGPVDYRTAEPPSGPGLTREERGLLDLLAEGVTLGEAARRLHLSRRTADRRLASARAKLGAGSTAEAVVALRRAR